jgi:hypothetical protein
LFQLPVISASKQKVVRRKYRSGRGEKVARKKRKMKGNMKNKLELKCM